MADLVLFSESPLNPMRITRQRAEAGLAFEKHHFTLRGRSGRVPLLFDYRGDRGPAVRESDAGRSIIDETDLASLPPVCFTLLHDERTAPGGPAGSAPSPAVRAMIESARELYLAYSAHALVDGTVGDSLRVIEEIPGAPMEPRRPHGLVHLADPEARLRAVQTLGWRGLSNLYLLADPEPAWLAEHGSGGSAQAELLRQLTRGAALTPYEDFHRLVHACSWVLTTHAHMPGQAPLCWYSAHDLRPPLRALHASSGDEARLVEVAHVADLPGYDRAGASEPRIADLHDEHTLRAAESLSLAGSDVVRLDELTAYPNIRALEPDGIPDLDTHGLARLPWLESLSVRWLKLDDLGFVRRLPALRHLALNRVPFRGFAGLEEGASLRSLSLRDLRISDPRFLRELPRLESLAMDQAEPPGSVLAAVAERCPALHALWFDVQGLTSIAALSGMRLQALSLCSTAVADLAPLGAMTSLRELWLQHTPVVDLTPIRGLQQLESLWLLGTEVRDLAPLASLTALRTLELQQVPVAEVGALATLSALERLYLDDTGVSEIAPLASLQHLRELGLSGTRVTHLEPLARLPSLTWLDLRDTSIADYSPLLRAPRLATLIVRDDQVPEPVRTELARSVELIVR